MSEDVADCPPINIDLLRQGIDLVREATVLLRTTRFKDSPDGKRVLGLLNDAHIAFAESHAMFEGFPPKRLKAAKLTKGGL